MVTGQVTTHWHPVVTTVVTSIQAVATIVDTTWGMFADQQRTVPMPPAAFLRAAFYRRLRQAMVSQALRDLITEAMDPHNEGGIRTPQDLLREVEMTDPAEGARFVRAMGEFHPRILVNGVRSAEDVRLGFSIASVCRRYFGAEVDYLGYVNHDEAVRLSVAAREPLVTYAQQADAAIYLNRIARKISGPPPAVSMGQPR